MPIRDILVLLDDSKEGEARVRLAAQLAHASRAHLIGAVTRAALVPPWVDLQPVDRFGTGYIPEARERERAREIADGRTRATEAMLHEVAHAHGLTDEWHEVVDDDPLDAVVGLAYRADLVVVGQPLPEHPLPATVRDIPEMLVLSSGRPVLFVPYIGAPAMPPQRALICWKDTRTAARAVNDALPLLANAEVTVLTIDGGPDALERTSVGVVAHLTRHGIKASVSATISDDIPVADVILNYASDLDAQLIVMGGYGHSRTREHLLGGVTSELLRTMTVPVLMSH
ncbi:MAG TPA: universal stress protein [Acetobacteraceae bacterium]|jgi:nucleotide-binding universal stress UspA family protein|nr:universal stress protein [Acetobacteraceae bacterium]